MKISEKQFPALSAEAKIYFGVFVKALQYQKARKLDCNKNIHVFLVYLLMYHIYIFLRGILHPMSFSRNLNLMKILQKIFFRDFFMTGFSWKMFVTDGFFLVTSFFLETTFIISWGFLPINVKIGIYFSILLHL